MSTNMSLRVKLKLVCPCRMLTSDRHAEEGNPKYTNRKKKNAQQRIRTILYVPPKFINISRQSSRLLQLILKTEMTFHKRAAVFSIVTFCCGLGSQHY